jgi:hypothetical protein
MAKTGGGTPLIITIAEKLGTAVGTIVAKTSDVVEGATKSLQPSVPNPKPRAQKTARSSKARAPKRKPSTMKKKVTRAAKGKTSTGKRPARN